MLRAARRAGSTVIVDETFVDLGFTGPARPAAAIDPSVVTIGSLSKTVWGGLRIGWIRAQADLVQRAAALRAATDMGGALLDQLIAVELVDRLDELAEARVAEVRPRRDALLAALARDLPGWRVSAPQGGLSLWAELDAPLSTSLSVLARSAGVHIVPGSRFGADGTLERYLRLPYTQPADVLERAVTRLREVWTTLDRSSPRPAHSSSPDPKTSDRLRPAWDSSDAGERLTQRIKTHGAQAKRLGVKVLEAEGRSVSRDGVLPGLQPDPLTEPVGRGLPRQAETATELGAQLPFVPAGVGAQQLPGERGVHPLAFAPPGAPWHVEFQVHPDVQRHLGDE